MLIFNKSAERIVDKYLTTTDKYDLEVFYQSIKYFTKGSYNGIIIAFINENQKVVINNNILPQGIDLETANKLSKLLNDLNKKGTKQLENERETRCGVVWND